MKIDELLQKALHDPDPKWLSSLRERRVEVLAFLDLNNEERRLERVLDIAEVEPEWLGSIFGALAGDVEFDNSLELPHAREDAEIGEAFRDVLMKSLPPRVRALQHWLTKVESLSSEERKYLAGRTDTLAAAPFSNEVLAYGVTPLVVFRSFGAVSALVQRATKQGILDDQTPLTIDVVEGFLAAGPDPIRAETVIAEIMAFADTSHDLARALAHWMIPALWCLPRACEMVRINHTPLGVELFSTKRIDLDLRIRWHASMDAVLHGLGETVAASIDASAGRVLELVD